MRGDRAGRSADPSGRDRRRAFLSGGQHRKGRRRRFRMASSPILLSHTPEIYRQAAHADFKLMLSGHTHGGQICLPGAFRSRWSRPCHDASARERGPITDMIGYTSVGAGSIVVPVRLNCPPEITLHRLHCGLNVAQYGRRAGDRGTADATAGVRRQGRSRHQVACREPSSDSASRQASIGNSDSGI